jgi:hypothetical protein
MMKIVQRLWSVAGLPCRECGGKGYVIDRDIVAFIQRNGLAMYQVATTLMENEIHYGCLGSLPCVAWEDVGLSDDQIAAFLEIAHCHVLHSCHTCRQQPNHPSPLSAATAVIAKWSERRGQERAAWEARQAPEDRRLNRRRRMASAIRYAQTPKGFEDFDNEAAE